MHNLKYIILLIFLISTAALANDKKDFKHFGMIPILSEGRIKPLDTFARVTLLGIYGKSALKDLKAIDWLAELLFDQRAAYHRPVFKIRNSDVQKALALEPHENQIYSFIAVSSALKKISPLIQALFTQDSKERSPAQNQLLELYMRVSNYLEISRSISLLVPQFTIGDEQVAKSLDLPAQDRLSYLQVIKRQSILDRILSDIKNKKSKLSKESKDRAIALSESLNSLSGDSESKVLRIVPPQFEKSPDREWVSPWQVVISGQGTPQTVEYFNLWANLSSAYFSPNPVEFEKLAQEVYDYSNKMAQTLASPTKLRWEQLYNQYDLFVKAVAFYILSFLLLCISWLAWKGPLEKASFVALILGAIPHFTGLVIRCYIMARPPVSTLYESIVFVAFIAVLASIFIEARRKGGVGTFIGSVIGIILLFISFGYEKEGDSMGMLAAVLDTNFWLATHVVTITIGYGCCFVASLLGHIYLLIGIFNHKLKRTQEEIEALSKNMLGATLFALFFSVLGTILGGIWADQSWGRFWGWDPKENGAMLICLWLLWAIHGRLSGYFKKASYAAIMCLTSIVVVIAWFGVNLLNVGLHSYGFTESIANNILIFTTLEILFTAGAFWIIQRRQLLTKMGT